MIRKAAVWIAGALALGWIVTAGSAVALPGGHPPSWYFVGGLVVLLSFPLAPIGAGAALVVMRRARREGTIVPRLTVAALWLNLLFLVAAIVLWCVFVWAAARR
jgi:hypothetical protein